MCSRLFSRGGYAIVRGLVGLLQDEADSVNLSAMSALRMLSESRDGCDLLLAADSIPGLVSCLSEMKRAPILLGEALFSLGNLTKMVEAIQQAMEAGAVDRLVALLAEGEETSGVQMRALVLKCVWNIANLDEGKEATIKANGVAQIAPCLSSADEDIRRLAVGALLALLVDQAGKTAAIDVRASPHLNSSPSSGYVIPPCRGCWVSPLWYVRADGDEAGRTAGHAPR